MIDVHGEQGAGTGPRQVARGTGREVLWLRPARWPAAGWSLVGLLASALALWAVVDTGGHGLAVALLVGCLILTVPWLVQLVAPGSVAWRLDEHGLLVRRLHRRLVVGWDEVGYARVVSAAGDPALELHLRATAPTEPRGHDDPRTGPGTEPTSTATLRLPVGADVTALHRCLARHLGPVPPGPLPDGHDVGDPPPQDRQ